MAVVGPDNGTLLVKTGKGGAAAKAGHNLVIEVTSWRGSYDGESISLSADARSLRVRSGSGGLSPLGDEEKASIAKTIDDEVLEGGSIEFRSTRVARSGETLAVEGELDLRGTTRPIAFDLTVDDGGRVTGSAVVKQTDWGIKPYSTLFGTLKVADEVEVLIDARLPTEGDRDG
jgi:hypothetical protein